MRKGTYHTIKTKEKMRLKHLGKSPWNKGMKGIHLSSESEFKKGMTPWNKGLHGPSGKDSPSWKGGQAKMYCIVCGKEYYKDKCQVYRSRFCSHSCKAKYNLCGTKHWKWNGGPKGQWDKIKGSEIYKKWQRKVFSRDKFTCRLCGHRSKKSRAHGDKTSDIHAHHIETRKKNLRLCFKVGNGITLCKNCHELTYGKEEQFAKVFKEILRDCMSNMGKP